MKKILLLCVFTVLAVSCGSLDQKSQTGLKGNWTISQVSYPGSDYIKVNSFNIADSKCFEGSSWKFVSNNNTGTIDISKPGCPSFSSPIVWTITKEGDFTLKITEGVKAKKVAQGYYLKMRNQTENSFQLVDRVDVGGNTVDVIYQFQKM
ncbi:lipocalin family protein [Flavobacterium litorale]|uniref:Lipocalin family protein n=1 Tax=Flavobacterium litorale TaxID=2856519 RepID=A0ABX8V807_9FLAO|nr:lipocalin family protein [Flavobacterium litorale]QYJ67348.1 lipocalin family protein [Flavobacterium litorale]